MAKKKKEEEEGFTIDGEDTIFTYVPQKAWDELKEKEKKRGAHKQDNGQRRSRAS